MWGGAVCELAVTDGARRDPRDGRCLALLPADPAGGRVESGIMTGELGMNIQ